MNRKEKLILVKKAAANVARGGATALTALIVPPFVTRLISPEVFGAWSLVLQLSAYITYLDFGIQTAVGRFVAHANESGDTEHRNRIASTSLAGLCIAGILGLAGIIGVAIFLPHIFRQMPANVVDDTKMALILVGGSLAVGVPASVFNGIFVGLQRNEVPAFIIAGSRLISAFGLIFVVRNGGSLVSMGAVVALVNVASYVVQYWMYRTLAGETRLDLRLVSANTGRELADYCLSLTVWSFAMLLIAGLDLALVGVFQFQEIAYYAVAISLVTFLSGLQNAIFSALISPAAVLNARGDAIGLGHTVVSATRYGMFLLLVLGLPLILFARPVLSIWVGPAYADHAAVLQVLVIANIIRLSAAPYAATLIGTGQQRLVILTPLVEGFSNLFASVAGGIFYGALGVALGTLFGALMGVGGNLVYNMRRTVGVECGIPQYLRDGLLRPVICAFPLITFAILMQVGLTLARGAVYVCLLVVLVVTGIVVWQWGLVDSEREKVRSWRLVLQV
jgi:O-antigen/teichoic acid export membrane protein